MADSKQDTPAAAGAAPWGRIAGVAVLAGGVVAITVFAIRGESGTVETPDSTKAQVASTATAPEAFDDELAQIDFSNGVSETWVELTRKATSTNLEEAIEGMRAMKDYKEARQSGQPSAQTTGRATGQTTGQAAPLTTGENATGMTTEQLNERLAQYARDRIANAPENLQPVPGRATVPAPGAQNPNSNISFNELVYNFGDIYSTTPVHGRFVFTSAGSEDLVVERVQTNCGCTAANAADLRGSRWKPGEEGVIEFTYTPDQTPGAQSKTMTVFTNSADSRQVTLTLRANLIPAVKTSTQTANFGRIEAGNIGQSRILVESRDPDFVFKNFDLGDAADGFNWTYTELDSVDPNYPSRGQLLIQTKADAPTGQFNRTIGRMIVMSRQGDDSAQTESTFNIQIRGEIVGDIEITPPFARTALATPGSGFEHRFVVSSRKGQAFNITDVKYVEGLATEVTHRVNAIEGSDGTSFELVVTGKAPDRTGGYMGRIEVYTDIPNHGPTPLQFSGVLRAAPPAQN